MGEDDLCWSEFKNRLDRIRNELDSASIKVIKDERDMWPTDYSRFQISDFSKLVEIVKGLAEIVKELFDETVVPENLKVLIDKLKEF